MPASAVVAAGVVALILTISGLPLQLAFIVGAALFVIGLHLMNSPATARTGNRLSAVGMIVAISAEVVFVAQNGMGLGNWAIIIAGLALGGGLGLRMARTVAMTSMPAISSPSTDIASWPAALRASTAGGRSSS